jgi:hypothetical protein
MTGAGVERTRTRDVIGRAAFGFVGATINALALVATIVGVIAQAIRDQENSPALAGLYHLGYALLNVVAIAYLLSLLGDEDIPAVPVVIGWIVGTGALLGAYWTWVL